MAPLDKADRLSRASTAASALCLIAGAWLFLGDGGDRADVLMTIAALLSWILDAQAWRIRAHYWRARAAGVFP